MMAKVNITMFQEMIDQGTKFTKDTLINSPFVAKGKSRAVALAKGIADLSTSLKFDHAVKDPNKRKKVIDELSLDVEPNSEKNITVVVNWLVTFVKNIMEKVNDSGFFSDASSLVCVRGFAIIVII